jgi:hypothetical protein
MLRIRWFLLVCCVPGIVTAQDKRELVQRGKAATAFLDLPQKEISATAVCIHKSGLFVTNEHAVKNVAQGAKVKLIFNPNDDNRREVEAKILRQDAELDLAVLRAEGDTLTDFESLRLGDDTGLFETMSVTAFGFPFGKKLAEEDEQYPDVSVNVGRVTALRKRAGKLDRIQLDAQLNPGNSGGPVIDDTGDVVGIVQAGVFATGVNFAIPSSLVRSFLSKPELVFRPPMIAADKKHEPAEFQVQLVPFLRPLQRARVALELTTDGHQPRTFAAESADSLLYTIKATPIPAPSVNEPLWITGTVSFAQGNLSGSFQDRAIELNGATIKLSELRSIQWGDEPQLIRHDGTQLAGRPAGLESLSVDVGHYLLNVELARAQRLDLRPVDQRTPGVRYLLTVSVGNEELARNEGSLTIADTVGGSSLPTTVFTPYTGDKQTLELPDSISDAVLAGGGRLLLLHLRKSRKLAVYDVNQTKIARFLSLGSDQAFIAAGLEKLIVLAPSEGVIERWSLTSFERETTRPLPVSGVIKSIALGYASRGPLLIHAGVSTDALARTIFAFVDLEKFEPLPIQAANNGHYSSYRDAVHIRASGTGDVFGMWCTSHSPQGMQTLVLLGKDAKVSYQHDSAGHIAPNFDGSAILTGFAGECTPDLNRKGGESHGHSGQMPTIPSTHPRFYVAVPSEPGAQFNLGGEPFANRKPTLHTLGSDTRIADLPSLDLGKPVDNASWSADDFTLDKRVLFVPQANQLVSIPFTNDRLIVQRFDTREVLEKANVDYFYVTSVPPRLFRKGERYHYTVEVASRKGGVDYELSSGPPGMSLSKSGDLYWNVPGDFANERVSVIITVRSVDGQTLYDSFQLTPQ